MADGCRPLDAPLTLGSASPQAKAAKLVLGSAMPSCKDSQACVFQDTDIRMQSSITAPASPHDYMSVLCQVVAGK